MFKLPIAVAIGLTVASAAAHADVIVIQGTPSFEPAIINHGPHAPLLGDALDRADILSMPAFHRLSQMCETLGMDCGAEHATAEGGIVPEWTPRHIADAEKRLAQMIEDREDYVAALEEHFEALPAPRPAAPFPHRLFGWNTTPHGVPHVIAPRPQQFGHVFPTLPRATVPQVTLPRPVVPGGHDLSGFYHRLNTPGAVVPRSVLPRHVLPRHGFPWRSF